VSPASGKRLTLAWLALSAITIAQLGVGSLGGRRAFTPDAAITSTAIVIALVKVRIVFREFMEVRHAPRLLCRLTDLWLVSTGAMLLGCYLVGTALSTG
jgi:hypothetical protein